MENNYEKIAALVPEGEHFDATAINEGVFLTESHLANIEVSLKNADALAGQMQQQLDTEKQTATDLQKQLDTANESITAKDTELQTLQAEVDSLKQRMPAGDFKEPGKEKDEHGGGEVKVLDEITQEANKKRAAKGLPLIK